jgi:hypothetical protein
MGETPTPRPHDPLVDSHLVEQAGPGGAGFRALAIDVWVVADITVTSFSHCDALTQRLDAAFSITRSVGMTGFAFARPQVQAMLRVDP